VSQTAKVLKKIIDVVKQAILLTSTRTITVKACFCFKIGISIPYLYSKS